MSDAESLSGLDPGPLACQAPCFTEALNGCVEVTHRLLLRQLLDSIDFLQGQIDAISGEIDTRLVPHQKLLTRR